MEFQSLDASENSERVENKEETTVETEVVSQQDTLIQTVKTTEKDLVINTHEKKNIDISCSRQTISHMEVVSVEDQIIQVFCEQVLAQHSAANILALISS